MNITANVKVIEKGKPRILDLNIENLDLSNIKEVERVTNEIKLMSKSLLNSEVSAAQKKIVILLDER